jgi:prolipoprotein diacylglyceryltransferase
VASRFLFGLWNASRRALRENVNPEAIFDCGTWLLVGAIMGARDAFTSFRIGMKLSRRRGILGTRLWWKSSWCNTAGWSITAGLIGASAACVVFARRRKLRSGDWRTSWRRAWRWVRSLGAGAA